MSGFKVNHYKTDLCVIGGGLAGMCAAISAARSGIKVVLMQDRPVLGGNASSEIRMWICGAHGRNNRETGLVEEISLENFHRNPYKLYPIWDSILYEKVRFEKNITLLLNCSCNDAQTDGDRIISVTGWQLTTQSKNVVEAKFFADCSGDSILAPITGAEYRMGREARNEFGESIAPEQADSKTMGNSCLIQAREYTEKREFIPPVWANHYTKEDLPYRMPNMKNMNENFWYMEIGGESNTIDDAEEIRDELLKIAFGIWDYVKNSGDVEADNWDLDFVGFLPGKRESRRYVGDHIMTQNDVSAEGRFDDMIAYGGWTMDDHDPAGIATKNVPNIFHPAPSPFGIPYRCIYSKNISNLFFAGRNISVTHSAFSSVRVMATCAALGQAAGIAAYLAVKNDTTPRGVYQEHITELQNMLMDCDCYLPWHKRQISPLCLSATLSSSHPENAENVRNGLDRPIGDKDNGWYGEYLEYSFENEQYVKTARFVFDSDLNRETVADSFRPGNHAMVSNMYLCQPACFTPQTMLKDFNLEITDKSGNVKTVEIRGNYQRLCKIPVEQKLIKMRFIPLSTYGSDKFHIFSFDFS